MARKLLERDTPNEVSTPPMFHFFQKNREFVRCEIHEHAAGGWHIVITEPSGHARGALHVQRSGAPPLARIAVAVH